jgi:dinuclear metal center YbgI/SA1388 family protein
MTLLRDVVTALDTLTPPALAEKWDNVGLLVGDRSQHVTRALLCIDYTPDVAQEARELKYDLVIAYHPPIFEGLKRLTDDRSTELLIDALRRGVAIYSPHTALDVAEGGTNDVLADLLSLGNRRALRLRETRPTHHKLVVFVPVDAVDRVSNALFAAGAGTIGDYTRCSFRTRGQGTFLGGPGTTPAVGKAGEFEVADEVRLEVLVEIGRVERVLEAMKRTHPYEEVAFDLQVLTAPQPDVGIGRIGTLPSEITLEMLTNLLKRGLGVDRLLVAGEPDQMIKQVALCAGAGGELLTDAIAKKADLYLTGELRHHDALRARHAGVCVICTLHSNSERVALAHYVRRLGEALPAITFQMSQRDRDPFSIW